MAISESVIGRSISPVQKRSDYITYKHNTSTLRHDHILLLFYLILEEHQNDSLFHHALIILQHESIYTLGRGATTANLKFTPSVDVVLIY